MPRWAALTLGLTALLAACGQPAFTVPGTATVKKGNLSQTVGASGVSVAATQSKLSFQVAGKISAVNVAAGDTVTPGQVLARLDRTALQDSVQQAQAALALAQAKVDQLQQSAKPATIAQAQAAQDAASQKLSQMLAGGRPEQVAQAQAQVDAANQKLQQVTATDQQLIAQAQANLQAGQAKLQALKNGPRPEQVAVLQQQVAIAKNNLYTAQITRDALCAGVNFGQSAPTGTPANCAGGQAAVNAAQTGVDQATDQLRLATAAPTSTDLQQAQAAVDQAQAQLAIAQSNAPKDTQQAQAALTQAQQALALAKQPYTAQEIQQQRDLVAEAQAGAQLAVTPYTDADLAAVQAGVEQADAALAQARHNLDNADLKAPAGGKVLQVNNAVGEQVTPASIPVVLGIGDILVNASLPQSSVAQVKVGDEAEVTFDSLPGKVYPGKVTDLPPVGTSSQNLVSYVATVKLDKPDGDIRAGMNASITIYTLRRDGVLLVPNLAVQSYQGQTIVQLVKSDGTLQQVPVETGASDAQNTEIVSGLTQGQTVALTQKPLNGLPLTSSSSASAVANPAPAPSS